MCKVLSLISRIEKKIKFKTNCRFEVVRGQLKKQDDFFFSSLKKQSPTGEIAQAKMLAHRQEELNSTLSINRRNQA